MKDASQDPVERRAATGQASSSKRRSRSRSSINPRSIGPDYVDIRPVSATARENPHKANLNNFRTSFENRLMNDGTNDDLSPREILRRARDRSVREMSQSMNESRSKSPHSQRL